MHIWKLTNEKGQTARFRTDDFNSLPDGFGVSKSGEASPEISPVIRAERIDTEAETEENEQ